MKCIARTLLIGAAMALGAGSALAQPCSPGRPHGAAQDLRCSMPPPGQGRGEASARQRAHKDLGAMQQLQQRRPGAAGPGEARRHEFERLREEVRSGRMSREEALRKYREQFGEGSPVPEAGRVAAARGESPDPGGSMGEIERLREAVRDGRMSPQEARERLRELRMRRATEAGRLSPEEREQLRRDILDANRDLERR